MEHPSAPVPVNYQSTQPDAIFDGPVSLARGRQARDPQARTVTYNINSLDEFETSLREYLNHPPDEPEHTDCQLTFWIGSSFLVAAPADASQEPQQHQPSQRQPSLPPSQHRYPPPSETPPGFPSAHGLHSQQQQHYGAPTHYQSVSDPALALTLAAFPHASSAASKKPEPPRLSISVQEALQPTPDPKEKMRKQRAIAKCCVDAIQKADGYRYSFHNCWNSREDDSFRFSYYCNDSLLNKDRAANGKGAKLGKRATKPVFDCKGVLSVKFSANKQSLDVFYKHVPIHKTYEERAPTPRKDSKRRKFLEVNDPDALERIQSRPKPLKPEEPLQPKPKKKKRPEDTKSPTSLESDLRAQSLRSLLELIRHDPAPGPSGPPPPPPPPPQSQPRPPNMPVQPPIQQHSQAAQQPQAQQPPPRKRPRNSCDVCKAKKTKCDGTRPVCQTCIDKKRNCMYTADPISDDRRPSMPTDPAEVVPQPQAAPNELSELEKMKRELEEARARIQELEEEKKRPPLTPSQTPQMPRRQPPQAPPAPPSQPHSDAKSKTPTHSQQRQPKHQPPQQQQQQQQPQPQQIQMQNQQLQNAAQPLPNSQQLQSPQYNHFGNQAPPTAYGLNRPMSSQNISGQNLTSQNMPPSISSSQNVGRAPPPQANAQLHAGNTGLTPSAEDSNPYGRDFAWPAAAYYGYQSAQQHQPDPWTAPRNPGVFR